MKRNKREYRVVIVPPRTSDERRLAEERWQKAAQIAVDAALAMLDPMTRAEYDRLPDMKRRKATMLITQAWLARPVHGPLEGEKKAKVERYLKDFLRVLGPGQRDRARDGA